MHTRQTFSGRKGGVSVAAQVQGVNAVFHDSSACTTAVSRAARLEAFGLERRPA
jgi:hypothetical protein